MKPTFLNQTRPLITSMIGRFTPDETRFTIKNSIYAGADAIGIQLCAIKKEFHTEEHFKNMFAAAGGRPVYITNYRYLENEGLSDDECMDGILLGLRCGATLADIMGDTFDKTEGELTKNPEAIRRQMELIDKIHDMGKEVLMSTHTNQFMTAEQVLEIALAQQERGVDIVKIVGGANSVEEEMENLRITTILKKELKVPFFFLSNGTHTKIHRMIGPQLGCIGYLCVYDHTKTSVVTQPTVAAAKAVRDNLDYMPDVIY